MQAADFAAFSRMLALVAEQYGKKLSPEMMRLYFDGCSHLSLEAARSALNRHVRNTEVGQFMPKVADIVRAADGGADAVAFTALRAVQDAFSSAGAWETPTFADPVISNVIADMGGWPEVCNRNADEWANFGSKEFVRRYRAYREQGKMLKPRLLPGLFDRTNVASGFEPKGLMRAADAVLIPDQSKAA